MEGRSYGLIRVLLWNLKGNGRKRLLSNTGIIVEYKRKWREEVRA
jgi:hypothetical protein